jgi:polysaccharide biosynthesis transport protein
MEEPSSQNTNYAEILKRRLPMSLVIGAILTAITVGLATGLPSLYKSRAVILIEQQEIPQDLVRSLVTSFAEQRVQVISQRVLTNSNLTRIIQEYGLYSRERVGKPLEVVLEQMRGDVSILPISADVVDPKQGKTVQATIAFELAYENRNAQLAQRVANEIVSLFLNENLKQRTETSKETLDFLTAESEKLRTEVGDLETKLAVFKEGNIGQLPELANLNIELMNRTENEVSQLDSQLRSLEQQRVYLESELTQQNPNALLLSESGERILGPADRLKILESEFIPLAARYGPSHPDVVSKKKEIESLRAQAGAGGESKEVRLRLQGAEVALAEAQLKYSAGHPDIKKLQREVAALRSELASQRPVASQPTSLKADNPAYVQLQARLEATVTDIRSLQNQRAAQKSKLAELESRMTKAPQVERQYRMLTRDYESAQLKYQEVLAKRQEAELATNLESKQQGERFTLIEPPVVPEEPSKPNRLAIGLLGGLLSIAGGAGSGALAESLDSRLYGRNGVARLLGVPPLAVIPNIETTQSLREKARRKLIGALIVAIMLLTAALMVHFLYRPLDVLLFQILRIVGS